MTEKEKRQVSDALHEARGALQTIASPDNMVGNIIIRVDLALERLRASDGRNADEKR